MTTLYHLTTPICAMKIILSKEIKPARAFNSDKMPLAIYAATEPKFGFISYDAIMGDKPIGVVLAFEPQIDVEWDTDPEAKYFGPWVQYNTSEPLPVKVTGLDWLSRETLMIEWESQWDHIDATQKAVRKTQLVTVDRSSPS